MPTTYHSLEDHILDEKIQDTDTLLLFLKDSGADYITLLALILREPGLPLRDESEADDKRIDDIEEARSNLISDFGSWAYETGRLATWVEEHMQEQEREAAEDLASFQSEDIH